MSDFLETGRIVLRAFTTADTEHLLALDNDPEVMRFINGSHPTSREAIEGSEHGDVEYELTRTEWQQR